MERKSMGSFIAALRKSNGLTQKDLAEKLNVSDKSVSRWERDEGAPDLSLIPVISEIFGITSDELLCGERKPIAMQEPCDITSPRAEKQRQRLLAVSLSRYKSISFVAGGLAACGLIAALIANLAFLRAYIGFFAGAVFFLAAAIVQLVGANAAFLTVSDSAQDDVEVGLFRRSVILIAQRVIGLSVVLFGATIPLISFVYDAYLGLGAGSFFKYGLQFAAIALVLYCTVCYVLNYYFLTSGTYTLDERRKETYHHNFKLKRRCTLVLVAVLLATAFLNSALTAWGDTPSLAKGTVFEDFESFKAYMEQDIPHEEEDRRPAAPVQVSPSTYYDQDGNVITEEEALTRDITDSNGNILCSFVHRNNSVWAWRYSTYLVGSITDSTNGSIEGVLPITAYTKGDIDAAQRQANMINSLFLPVYWLEVIAAIVVYYRRKKA